MTLIIIVTMETERPINNATCPGMLSSNTTRMLAMKAPIKKAESEKKDQISNIIIIIILLIFISIYSIPLISIFE